MNSARKEFGPWSKQTSSAGREYYYNKDTEVSQWEKPKEWRDYEIEQERLEQQRAQMRGAMSPSLPPIPPGGMPPYGMPPFGMPMTYPPPLPFGFPPPPLGVGPPPFAQFPPNLPPPPHMPVPMQRHIPPPPAPMGMGMSAMPPNGNMHAMQSGANVNKYRGTSTDSFPSQHQRVEPPPRIVKIEPASTVSTSTIRPSSSYVQERNREAETYAVEEKNVAPSISYRQQAEKKPALKRDRVESDMQHEQREVKKVKEEDGTTNWRMFYNPDLAKKKRAALKLDTDEDLRYLVLESLQLEHRLVAELMKMKTASALVAVQEHEVLLCKGKIINLQEQQKALEQREHMRAREMPSSLHFGTLAKT